MSGCRIHALRTDRPGELRIDVETPTPNLARLEVRKGSGQAWQATPAGFTWAVQPGENVLEVRGVNAWGKVGPAARLRIVWSAE